MATDIKSILYKRKWVEDILSCEKPVGEFQYILKENAKFRHGAGFYVTNIYSIKGDKDWIVGNNQNQQILVGSLEEIKDKLIKDGIDPEETVLPTLRNAAKKELN